MSKELSYKDIPDDQKVFCTCNQCFEKKLCGNLINPVDLAIDDEFSDKRPQFLCESCYDFLSNMALQYIRNYKDIL